MQRRHKERLGEGDVHAVAGAVGEGYPAHVAFAAALLRPHVRHVLFGDGRGVEAEVAAGVAVGIVLPWAAAVVRHLLQRAVQHQPHAHARQNRQLAGRRDGVAYADRAVAAHPVFGGVREAPALEAARLDGRRHGRRAVIQARHDQRARVVAHLRQTGFEVFVAHPAPPLVVVVHEGAEGVEARAAHDARGVLEDNLSVVDQARERARGAAEDRLEAAAAQRDARVILGHLQRRYFGGLGRGGGRGGRRERELAGCDLVALFSP
ncbi:MAG: hypothetical protein BWX69_03302 [Planctomycetes bacterium ADurb.Bin069]|nr:MAG: hypothetical protein BWX69_03302 [Planctomycetes bacterium ADurb.Bin069]